MRFGLDNVVRANDACSFVCAYKKLPHYTSDPGPFMEGAIVSHHPHRHPPSTTLMSYRTIQVRKNANQESKKNRFDAVSYVLFSPWCRSLFSPVRENVFGESLCRVLFSSSPPNPAVRYPKHC